MFVLALESVSSTLVLEKKQEVSFAFFQALGMPQEAIVCYQRAIQMRPNYAIAYGKCSCLMRCF